VVYTGSSGSHESDETALNLHAAWSGDGGWYADTLLSFGHRQTNQARRTQYGNAGFTVNQSYRARYDTTTRRLALTLGHRFDRGTWSIDPYARLEQQQSDVDAYDETASAPDAPGGGWAVSVERQEERQRLGTIGLRANWVISGESGVFLPYLDVGWVTLLDADENDAFVRYTGDRSDAVGLSRLRFAMRADAEDDRWGRVAVGIAAQFAHGRAGFLRYVQTFGENRYSRRELQLGGRFEF
jgi:outer membrane autotransporter protein